ncbi:MAG: type II toxin-antitoxin system death-on-curing family toxin [Actinobacteria bacterium]|jgi:death-on-curing protein|nr:MAG: type II toxin-antitoxin system death-on-curing family toxin [Actinomycetota bacterium]
MAAPLFLTLAEVLEIHQDQLRRYGGRSGIRDLDLLKSAMAMPQAGMGEEYFHADIIEMAAAYLFHIVRNHPFIDGNKRTEAVAALVFLALNGFEVEADEAEFERLVRKVAEGRTDKGEITGFLRANTR